MFVFEIIIPGTWLDYEDSDWTWEIEGLLHHLQSQFFEANAALNLFIDSSAVRSTAMNREIWERDSQRRCEIERMLEHERGGIVSHEMRDELRFEAEIRFKRERWASGRMPRELEHNRSLIHARAFLYALDAFDKFLSVLSKEPGAPSELLGICAQMAEAFPDLRGVRNTAQHMEDRARGLGRNAKPLDLQPIQNGMIDAPGGGILMLNSLNGSRFTSTMADGHCGEIDVSSESMQQLQRILNTIFQTFRWSGPKQHAPSV